jgi:mannose-6-phosphate isomerase-like protein (cupin superfamily)
MYKKRTNDAAPVVFARASARMYAPRDISSMLHNPHVMWQTHQLESAYDVLAPDGSEIRLLVQVQGGSMVHCRLQPGQVTLAVRHRTVEEMWYCVAGAGQLWRNVGVTEEVVELEPGVALNIPLGAAFQFRASQSQPLELVIATIPPWPGPDEAVPTDGIWKGAGA